MIDSRFNPPPFAEPMYQNGVMSPAWMLFFQTLYNSKNDLEGFWYEQQGGETDPQVPQILERLETLEAEVYTRKPDESIRDLENRLDNIESDIYTQTLESNLTHGYGPNIKAPASDVKASRVVGTAYQNNSSTIMDVRISIVLY